MAAVHERSAGELTYRDVQQKTEDETLGLVLRVFTTGH